MKRETSDKVSAKLAAVIAAIKQAQILDGLTPVERRALDLLESARVMLVGENEQQFGMFPRK